MVMKKYVMLLFLFFPLIVKGQTLEFHSVKKLPSTINSTGEESLPLLSPDGRYLFFSRALFAGNAGGKFSGVDVWHSEASANQWKTPSNSFPVNVNNEGHNAVIGMSRDGNTRYFMSASSHEKMNGIYITARINNYGTRPDFVAVPGIDNQNFLGVHVSPDFDVIFFSMKAEDSRGEEDLYFSVKSATGQWSVPKNMGTTINTNGYEISPF